MVDGSGRCFAAQISPNCGLGQNKVGVDVWESMHLQTNLIKTTHISAYQTLADFLRWFDTSFRYGSKYSDELDVVRSNSRGFSLGLIACPLLPPVP